MMTDQWWQQQMGEIRWFLWAIAFCSSGQLGAVLYLTFWTVTHR